MRWQPINSYTLLYLFYQNKFWLCPWIVQVLSCWQTNRQTHSQTDTTENNTTFAVQVVNIHVEDNNADIDDAIAVLTTVALLASENVIPNTPSTPTRLNYRVESRRRRRCWQNSQLVTTTGDEFGRQFGNCPNRLSSGLSNELWSIYGRGFSIVWLGHKGAITSKIKHAIKLKTSPARLAQQLLQPSLAFCFSFSQWRRTAQCGVIGWS